ncbi:cofactor-independent phosphoglycerate mutase [Kiritimatiella glycovorans]|uniref:Cofactor-independent phosphoglycerate mutase n=1 Tax=Kiritimatiella glycovorans TaxID=1307763 RepID=A0A0G3EDU8_9BACT|nr:cofactor-independent phosphoglycerate mutase [Kiritimatiella glycovorans]AKJ64631.1 cofactor-independent phosphoglycerate mutase [Kiritimatiella glycovorans]
MRTVILTGDGMGDYPLEERGGRTPLELARIPAMRRIAAAGRVFPVRTIPEGMEPGSDVANMALMGYDAGEHYTGRAPIEAAGMGMSLEPDDIAFRCNLVHVREGMMEDYSAGHITDEEGAELMGDLQRELGGEGIAFYPGVGYRHLMVIKNGPRSLRTEPPHEFSGDVTAAHMPTGEGAEAITRLMERSRTILAGHPVNRRREQRGERTATQIWLWGQGAPLHLPKFSDRYGMTGGVVSAVTLVKGIGRLVGLEVRDVEGATGFIDTNYRGKREAVYDLLRDHAFAYLHVEAPDECGHMGDADKKIEAIEAFDREIVAPVWNWLEEQNRPYRLIVATDHRTPIVRRGHTDDPVPMAMLDGPAGPVTDEAPFDESAITGQTVSRAAERVHALLLASASAGVNDEP